MRIMIIMIQADNDGDTTVIVKMKVIVTVTAKEKEIKRRIAMGWQAFGRARSVFKDKNIPNVLKRRIYDQCILPSVTHGTKVESHNEDQSNAYFKKLCLISPRKIKKTANWIRGQRKMRHILETISKLKWK
ncbi:uncharacterized protein [Penaeus vannamei]|uniref:uncharacterized protein n=1 Tax=Penaeus vannamei TaxID=6689 RepID=UPI00387F4646